MTTLLSQAIQEVEKLSEDAQNQIAEWLLSEISRILSETEGKGERQIDYLKH